MTVKKNNAELRAEYETLRAEAQELATRGEDLEGEEAQRFDAAADRLQEIKTELEARDKRQTALRDLVESGQAGIEHGSDTGVRTVTNSRAGNTIRDDARRLIERSQKAQSLPDHAAARAETLVRNDDKTARWVNATGNDAYVSAFTKMVRDPERGHLTWTPEESRAYQEAEQVRATMVENGTGTGHLLVPFQLDPNILLTSGGSISPLREVARNVQITGNAWNGLRSDGVTAEWLPEIQEVGDHSPVINPAPIPVHKASSWVQYSVELEEDAPGLLNQLGTLFQDSKQELENTAFLTGTGDDQPTGLLTALIDAGGSVIQTGTGTEALAGGDPYKLANALAPRWQPNAQFLANLSTINALAQLETANGSLRFPSLQNVPPTLLGRRVHEVSGMDSAINPAATEANYALIFGDLQQYLIVDRIGATIELVPHVLGPNRRPTGTRGAWLYWRVGADVLVPNAFNFLNVATTA